MQYATLLGIALSLWLTHLVAQHIGRKRTMGYGKAVFWCLLLSPYLGFFIVWSGRRADPEEEDPAAAEE
jgi:hypothetical protein